MRGKAFFDFSTEGLPYSCSCPASGSRIDDKKIFFHEEGALEKKLRNAVGNQKSVGCGNDPVLFNANETRCRKTGKNAGALPVRRKKITLNAAAGSEPEKKRFESPLLIRERFSACYRSPARAKRLYIV
jgi:hypothetical protein